MTDQTDQTDQNDSEETSEAESWLPNLVGGVSIWRLARDLNEPHFFDGRLLVPETEGSDSLPVKVHWDLTGLIPLTEARAEHPMATKQATEEFFACLERVAKAFKEEGSGYDRYHEAFTLPAIDGEGAACYFFSTKEKKLYVINWGASPRTIAQKREFLFGYESFGQLIEKGKEAQKSIGIAPGAPDVGATPAEAAAESAIAQGTGGGAEEEKAAEGEEEKEEEQVEQEDKKWWLYLLLALGILAAIAIAAFALKECDGGGGAGTDPATADGGAGSGSDPSAADGGFIYGEAVDSGVMPEQLPDGGILLPDGAVIGQSDLPDGSILRLPDGAVLNKPDAGPRHVTDGTDGTGGSGTGGTGGTGGSGGSGGSGGTVVDGTGGSGGTVVESDIWDDRTRWVDDTRWVWDDGRWYYRDPDGTRRIIDGPRGLPHREHTHPAAVQWRVVSGMQRVSRVSGGGTLFNVYLYPGEDFHGVQVQWRDRGGAWHDH